MDCVGHSDKLNGLPADGHKLRRYIVTVHALKVEKLGVPDDASAALIGYS
jgi:hypothetical protein